MGQQIGEYCVALLQKVIPHLDFETEEEIHRFCFGAGIVILTLAKDNAAGFAASAGPQYVRAICDAIEKPFVAMIKGLDISISAVSFLPDESEQQLYCDWSGTPKDELAASEVSSDLGVFLSLVYATRERQYYSDLRAAASNPESVSSPLGVMVFVYKRFMRHVYGIESDTRSVVLEGRLATKSMVPGNLFGHTYKLLYDYIEPLLADGPNA